MRPLTERQLAVLQRMETDHPLGLIPSWRVPDYDGRSFRALAERLVIVPVPAGWEIAGRRGQPCGVCGRRLQPPLSAVLARGDDVFCDGGTL